MITAPCKPRWSLISKCCMTVVLILGVGFCQISSQDSTGAASQVPDYFPPGLPLSSFFSAYLSFMGEPSLLEASTDASVVSYRLSWLAGQHGRVVIVRLIVNPDGTGQVISQAASGSPTVLHKANNDLSVSDVQKFLQFIEYAKFWSMRPTEQRTDGDTGHKFIEFDGTFWMVEGARTGSYHCVYRRSPEPSPFTEIGRYLAKDLARLDDSVISIKKFVPPSQ